MKKLFYRLSLLLSLPLGVAAQSNYVANTPNSATPGTNNTLVGPSAGNATMTGGFNAFLGWNAGRANTTGKQNTFVGIIAGSANTTGEFNAFFGAGAGQNNKTGNRNSFIGAYAGSSNTIGEFNTFVGANAGQDNTTGFGNAFVGMEAGQNNTTGYNNAFVGTDAGRRNTTGSFNIFMGSGAGSVNKTGSNNVFIGFSAGLQSTGNSNTFIGHYAGYFNTTGSRNTYLGQDTGGPEHTSGYDNVFLGYGAGAYEAPTVVSNAVAIGAYAAVARSNSMILGGTGPYSVSVGIGNTAPQNKLEITKGTANQSGLRFTNLTSSSPATLLNQTKFLTVNASGDVVLASSNSPAREAATESLWQRRGLFLESTKGEAVIIGQGVSQTPSDYNLFVSKGILTEKIKVAVKNTTDWSDKVFAVGYKLRSLSEVEQHIKQTGHLPGVPSAAEVVEKGVDLGKMDAKLLEKIEELTLYMIELKKENQSLRQALKRIAHTKGK